MALTQVSGGGIKDGSITNADLGSSAAIAGSKVTPNFGSQAITGGKVNATSFGVNNVNFASASYDNISYSVANDDSSPRGVFFSPDGLKMFIAGDAGNDVTQYNLSTAWAVNTATPGTVFSVLSQDDGIEDLFFRPDGLKMYIAGGGSSDAIYQYSLTSAWDISTATYESKSLAVGTTPGELVVTGLFFNPDGTVLYFNGFVNDRIYAYNLSTPWDISTASSWNSLTVGSQDSVSRSIAFTNDGSKLFLLGDSSNDVTYYNLTTPWNVSTANYVGEFSVSNQEINPNGLFVKPDGSKFYVVGTDTDTVYQYSIPSAQIDLIGPTRISGDTTVTQNIIVNGRIIANTSIGVGTSSPQAVLHLQKTQAAETGIFINNANASGYTAVRFGGSDRATNGDHLVFGGATLGLRSKTNSDIVFEANNSERMRIRSDGNVCIGGVGAGHSKLEIRGAVPGTAGVGQTWGIVSGVNMDGVVQYHNGIWSELNYGNTGSSYSIAEGLCYVATQGYVSTDLSSVFHQKGYVAAGFTKGTYNTGFILENFTLGANAGKTAWGFYGGMNLETGNEKYNLYLAGTGYNYINGNIGMQGAPDPAVRIYFTNYGPRVSSAYLIASNTYIPKETANYHCNYHNLYTESVAAGSAYTVGNAYGYMTQFASENLGTNSTVTSWTAFSAPSSTAATNNYNYFGSLNVVTGKNNWNIYMDGSAPSYFAGRILVGSTSSPDGTGDIEVGKFTATIVARTTADNGESVLEARSNTYLTGPNYNGTAIIYSGPTAADNYCGLSRANLGTLRFQNCLNALIATNGETPIVFATVGQQRARIDSSGRFLVGTSNALTNYQWFDTTYIAPSLQVANEDIGRASLGLFCNNAVDSSASHLMLAKASSGTAGLVSSGERLGVIAFNGADGTNLIQASSIRGEAEGTPSSTIIPGRLIFSTNGGTANANPTERMRITSGGYTKFSNDGTYVLSTGAYHECRQTANNFGFYQTITNATFTSAGHVISATKTGDSTYSLARYYTANFSDIEFNFRGDGLFQSDSGTSTGADYAEYFEWQDGNPDGEDRRGYSVILQGNKIVIAEEGDDPIGVISGNPSIVGDSAWSRWSGKYLRDDFGSYILEDYEVVNDEGETVVQQRRKLNPDYDPETEYVSREERPEWDCVGLVGKLRIRKGLPTGSRWIKMRDVSDSVEEWLVR